MERRTMLQGMGAGAILAAVAGGEAMGQAVGQTGATTVFELREYHAAEGKLDALLARFRDHTIAIFKRHGIESVGYWTPTDDPLKGKTLVYMLRHPSREAATANWAAFHDDPEWKSVAAASEVNGKLTTSIESTFLKLTDFSPRV
jgi:NIPSNAP